MSETLRVVLCVGQVRVLTCVLVSFCVTEETERGRESALRYPARPLGNRRSAPITANPESFVCGSRAFALPTHGSKLTTRDAS